MGIYRSDCHILGITDFNNHVLINDMRCTGFYMRVIPPVTPGGITRFYMCRASFHGAIAFSKVTHVFFLKP
jgi:hypothetical protein